MWRSITLRRSGSHLRQVCAQAFVEAKRHGERFELVPERLIIRIVPIATLTGLGREEMPLKPSSISARRVSATASSISNGEIMPALIKRWGFTAQKS